MLETNKYNALSKSIEQQRKDIIYSPQGMYKLIRLTNVLEDLGFIEQSLAYQIFMYEQNKLDFLKRKIEKYIEHSERYFRVIDKHIYNKKDLKLFIIENLWGGYSFYSAIWLEKIILDDNLPEDTRFEAAWEVGRWYHFTKNYDKVLDKVRLIRDSFNISFHQRKELVLLAAYTFIALQEFDRAREELRDFLSLFPNDVDVIFALASLENDKEKMQLINKVYVENSISKIEKKDENAALAFSNITSHSQKIISSDELVSIIVPVYNGTKSIKVAIESILSQSWNNLEIIIVDDYSTDLTWKVLNDLKSIDSRIKIIRQENNLGPYAARNKGLSIASGEFITTHDADDWSHPEKIFMQVEYLKKHPKVKGVSTYWIRTSEDLCFTYNWRVGKELIHWNHSSFLFRKGILKDIGAWDEVRVGADTEFIWRVQARYGINSVENIYETIPLSFALENELTLTRTSTTHIQSIYYGLRQIYRESAREWHLENITKLKLENNTRSFSVPCALLDSKDYLQSVDKLYVVDFSDKLSVERIKHSIIHAANAGFIVGVLHWQDLKNEKVFDKEYFKILSTDNVRPIVAGYSVEVQELIFLDRGHSLLFPEQFPDIKAFCALYITFGASPRKNINEITELFRRKFNLEDVSQITFYKLLQIKATQNISDVFTKNSLGIHPKNQYARVEKKAIEDWISLMMDCKLPSMNFFDENAVSYVYKKTDNAETNYNITNLVFVIDVVDKKNHMYSKIARTILSKLNQNDTFILFQYIVKLSEDDMSFMTKLYLLLLLNKKPEQNFMQFIALRMSRITKDDLNLLLELHALFDLVNRGAFKKNNFFLSIENTKNLYSTVTKLLKALPEQRKMNGSFKNKISKIVFVLARPFEGDVTNNSHFLVLESYAKLINSHNQSMIRKKDKIETFVLITGEKSFNLPIGDWYPITKKARINNIDYMVDKHIIENEKHLFFPDIQQVYNKTDEHSKSYEWMLEQNPDIVVFLGGTYDSKVFRYKTYNNFPITFLPTTSSLDNAYGKPDRYCNSIKAASPEHAQELVDFIFNEKNVVYFPKPFFIDHEVMDSKHKFNWQEHGLKQPSESFKVLTPLTGNRIANWFISMSDKEVEFVFKIFEKLQNLQWVFVGQSPETFKKATSRDSRFLDLLEKEKILVIDFTSQFKELLNEVDVVYLPSKGGATTVTSAIFRDISCIIPYGSDAISVIDENLHYESYIDSFKILIKLYSDEEFRNATKKASKELLKERMDLENIFQKFIGLLKIAQNDFNEKISIHEDVYENFKKDESGK